MDEYFINKNTKVDDIIERILFDFNNDLAGQGFNFHDYCIPIDSQVHNKQMEAKLRDKMFEHKLVNKLQNTLTSRDRVVLSGIGIDIYNKGGWKKFKKKYDKEQKEIKAQQNRPPFINNGNIVTGNIAGSVTQTLDLSSRTTTMQTPITPPIPYETKQNAITSTILKTIKYLIIPVVVGLILLYIEHQTHYFTK